MAKINFILGGDSITVFLDGKTYAVNKQAQTFQVVLNAVRSGDVEALRDALDIRKAIVKSLTATASEGKVRIDGSQIFYGDREVTGLVASRIFEVIRLGLDVKPMIRFLENMMLNPSKRAVDELFGFLDACNLPITEDGHFLAYKRVRDNYMDVHSGKFDNSVGKVLEMPRNLVDEDKNRTCSAGLHFCSYSYLSSFGGERIMVLKINPADVVAIPADYNNSKGRTCKYEVVDELPVNEYDKLPARTITEGYTDEYSDDADEGYYEDSDSWDESEEEENWDESWEESSEEETTVEDEIDFLIEEEIEAIVELVRNGTDPADAGNEYGVSEECVEELMRRVGPAPVANGDNTTGKLTPADVRAIRTLLGKGESLANIGRKFGVHPRSIARIRDGEAWNNV